MSKVLENLKYSPSHEWVLIEDGLAIVGISDYAQDSLGSIVYVEAGEIGDQVGQFKEFGAVESVKVASDIMSPVSGEIIEINEDVIENPELLNEDPYVHWIIKVRIDNESELDNLLDAAGYHDLLK